MKNDVFSSILGQPQVREFLRSSLDSDHFSQGYLFLGPSGSNKTLAARALAFSYLYPEVAREKSMSEIVKMKEWRLLKDNKHPDIKYFAPEGQNAYLISQVREIIADEELSPQVGKRKAYIIDRVDLLGVSGANAFLKTLEEPHEGRVFILLGRTSETVLPTIKSRCVVVPFRHIPPSEARAIVVQNSGFDEADAKVAIGACAGSISRAIEFLRNNNNVKVYEPVAKEILSCAGASDWECIKAAKQLLLLLKEPTDELRRQHEERNVADDEFLSAAAKKSIEASINREVKRQEKHTAAIVPNTAVSLLHDIFLMLSGRAHEVVNVKFSVELEKLSLQTTLNQLVDAMDAIEKIASVMAYNISLESCIDLILLEFKGAFSD